MITAPKIIATFISALLGFTALLEAPRGLSEPVPTTIDAQEYLIEPTTTTSSTMFIDPYATACEQFAALAVNLGWRKEAYPRLLAVITRESRCLPDQINSKDPNGGSFGLMQINGFWCRGAGSFLQQRGIVSSCEDLLHADTNLLAGLAIWEHSQWHAWGF